MDLEVGDFDLEGFLCFDILLDRDFFLALDLTLPLADDALLDLRDVELMTLERSLEEDLLLLLDCLRDSFLPLGVGDGEIFLDLAACSLFLWSFFPSEILRLRRLFFCLVSSLGDAFLFTAVLFLPGIGLSELKEQKISYHYDF